jgi:phenylalanyl-tRNA synthetase alpha chain
VTDPLQQIKRDFLEAIEAAEDSSSLQQARVAFLGKKGSLTESLKAVGKLSAAERPAFGQRVNDLRKEFEELLNEKQGLFQILETQAEVQKNVIDTTLPGYTSPRGSYHPLTMVEKQILQVFQSLGFSVEEGPDVESDYYNFEALNFPPNHPARDMQDTFFVSNNRVLRTHTSPVQIRTMEKVKPPVQIIVPGRVYRHDSDMTHSPVFHQMEGLCVGPNVTFADLKGVLETFVKNIFGSKAKTRFRPSFFPFTEPSAEMDVMGPHGDWMEIMGCGMVDPNVFASVSNVWEKTR